MQVPCSSSYYVILFNYNIPVGKTNAMMNWTVYLVLSVLFLYPGSAVVTTSSPLQTAGVPRVLQGNGISSGSVLQRR